MDKVLFNALITYFKAEKIKVSYRELELQLFSHPHTPSLYAVSETLNFLKIKNVAAQIEPNQLDQLPEHFIAFIDDEEKGQYFSHVQQNKNQVYLHGEKETTAKENFKKKWNGIILLAEQEDSANISEILWIKWAGIILTVLFTIILWPDIPSLIFCIIGVFGLYVSGEIFETTNNQSSYLGQKICGQEEESGCNKVLKSSDYHITLFSLNDLFFSFLLSIIILTLLNAGFGSVHTLIYLIALIVVVSTIIIQGFILKTWCRLCLLSSSIVLGQILVIIVGSSFSEISIMGDSSIFLFLKNLFTYGLLFSIVLLGIYSYRKLKIQNYKLSASEIDLLRFKRSPKTIKRALADTRSIEHIEDVNQLVFGNSETSQTICLVLSTTCGFCKKAFEKFYDFYCKNGSGSKFFLILNHYRTTSSKRNDIAATMINFYRNNKPDEFLKMMNRWFQHRDADKFFDEVVVNFTDEDYQILLRQRGWCEKNELFQTPILIINDKIMPDYYDASFLEDILKVMEGKE